VRFNNFSIQNLFDGSAWRPVPSGDGQTLALQVQTNGRFYRTPTTGCVAASCRIRWAKVTASNW
ncbi:MAG: hypothetical protein AAFX41_02800, partial [Bacteroidota bacterium]